MYTQFREISSVSPTSSSPSTGLVGTRSFSIGGGGTSTVEFDGATTSTAVNPASSTSAGACDASLVPAPTACWPCEAVSDSGGTAAGGNLNSRSMVPCLTRGGPLVLVDFICDDASCGSSPSPRSSGVGSKVLRTAFDGESDRFGGVGPGDVDVLDGAGIEARFAAFAAWAL